MPEHSKLTTNAVNNIDVDSHDTNKSSQSPHEPKKRALDEQNDESQSNPVDQVTVGQLERQVDDLVESYNKLAKTLNRPQIHEANANGIVFSTAKTVSRVVVLFEWYNMHDLSWFYFPHSILEISKAKNLNGEL